MRQDLLKYITRNLMHRKIRSWLTVVSILIGIMAIFALTSFGQGISKYTSEIFQKMGTDKLMVMPKGFGIPGEAPVELQDSDIEFIKGIKGVAEVSGMIARTAEVKQRPEQKPKYTYGMGVDLNSHLFEDMFSLSLIGGRGLKKGDSFKAVLGYNYMLPKKIFEKPVKLGDKIFINDYYVDVIGFYSEIGNPSDDAQIYMPMDTAKQIYNITDNYDYIFLKTSPGVSPSQLSDKIKEKLRKHRGQKEGQEDFFVQSFEELIRTYGTVILVINAILVIISLISVVVAGVNIMNTTYTAVLERTKEIGIMKSIGARNEDILFVFVIESGLLGLAGGILGVILGYIIAKIGEAIAKAYGLSMLRPAFPLWLIIGCLLFAFGVGLVAGLVPSYQASKLRPVDALRYE